MCADTVCAVHRNQTPTSLSCSKGSRHPRLQAAAAAAPAAAPQVSRFGTLNDPHQRARARNGARFNGG
eukprot:3510104-Rhodomonas_salina.1